MIDLRKAQPAPYCVRGGVELFQHCCIEQPPLGRHASLFPHEEGRCMTEESSVASWPWLQVQAGQTFPG